MFSKQELRIIYSALRGELDCAKELLDKKVAAGEDWPSLHLIPGELQRLMDKIAPEIDYTKFERS